MSLEVSPLKSLVVASGIGVWVGTKHTAGLTYREPFTPRSAQAIQNYFVNERDLQLDLDDLPDPGRIVFADKKASAPLN
jgi:hypothetical protein